MLSYLCIIFLILYNIYLYIYINVFTDPGSILFFHMSIYVHIIPKILLYVFLCIKDIYIFFLDMGQVPCPLLSFREELSRMRLLRPFLVCYCSALFSGTPKLFLHHRNFFKFHWKADSTIEIFWNLLESRQYHRNVFSQDRPLLFLLLSSIISTLTAFPFFHVLPPLVAWLPHTWELMEAWTRANIPFFRSPVLVPSAAHTRTEPNRPPDVWPPDLPRPAIPKPRLRSTRRR